MRSNSLFRRSKVNSGFDGVGQDSLVWNGEVVKRQDTGSNSSSPETVDTPVPDNTEATTIETVATTSESLPISTPDPTTFVTSASQAVPTSVAEIVTDVPLPTTVVDVQPAEPTPEISSVAPEPPAPTPEVSSAAPEPPAPTPEISSVAPEPAATSEIASTEPIVSSTPETSVVDIATSTDVLPTDVSSAAPTSIETTTEAPLPTSADIPPPVTDIPTTSEASTEAATSSSEIASTTEAPTVAAVVPLGPAPPSTTNIVPLGPELASSTSSLETIDSASISVDATASAAKASATEDPASQNGKGSSASETDSLSAKKSTAGASATKSGSASITGSLTKGTATALKTNSLSGTGASQSLTAISELSSTLATATSTPLDTGISSIVSLGIARQSEVAGTGEGETIPSSGVRTVNAPGQTGIIVTGTGGNTTLSATQEILRKPANVAAITIGTLVGVVGLSFIAFFLIRRIFRARRLGTSTRSHSPFHNVGLRSADSPPQSPLIHDIYSHSYSGNSPLPQGIERSMSQRSKEVGNPDGNFWEPSDGNANLGTILNGNGYSGNVNNGGYAGGNGNVNGYPDKIQSGSDWSVMDEKAWGYTDTSNAYSNDGYGNTKYGGGLTRSNSGPPPLSSLPQLPGSGEAVQSAGNGMGVGESGKKGHVVQVSGVGAFTLFPPPLRNASTGSAKGDDLGREVVPKDF